MKKEKAVSLDDGTGMVARWRRMRQTLFLPRANLCLWHDQENNKRHTETRDVSAVVWARG